MKTLSNKPLLAKIKTIPFSVLYGTLRKHKASSTTDIGAEGTSRATSYKREKTILGNPIDFPFNRTIETNYKIIKTI